MIVYDATRARSVFDSYSSLFTESRSFTGPLGTTQDAHTYNESRYGDSTTKQTSFTYSETRTDNAGFTTKDSFQGITDNFTVYSVFSSESSSESYTYETTAGVTSNTVTSTYTNTFSSTTSSTTIPSSYHFTVQTTYLTSYTTNFTTVTSTVYNSSYYTTSGTNFTTAISYHNINYSTTTFKPRTLTTTSYSNTPITTNISLEFGRVYLAVDHDEWLWSFSQIPHTSLSFQTEASFLTQIGNSFTKQTFWSTINTFNVDYAQYNFTDSAPPDITVVAENEFTATIEIFVGTATSSRIITSLGDNHFSRITNTTSFGTTNTSFSTQAFGFGSHIVNYLGTLSRSSIFNSISPNTTYSTYLFNDVNRSSSTLKSVYEVLSSISSIYAKESYQSRYYSAFAAATIEEGRTITAQSTEMIALIDNASFNVFINGIKRENPVGVFLSPQQLTKENISNFASNLSFNPRIQYENISSVFPGVVVPIDSVGVSSVIYDGTFTVSYSWSSVTLYFTKSSSVNNISTFTSSSSNIFQNMGVSTANYYRINGAYGTNGGYGDVSSATETLYVNRGGGIFITIGTDGGITESTSINQNATVSTALGRALVNHPISIYQTYALAGAGPVYPVKQIVRNLED